MRPPPEVLDLPTPRAVRLVARWLVEEADQAEDRRRALRRLRRWLRAWRHELSGVRVPRDVMPERWPALHQELLALLPERDVRLSESLANALEKMRSASRARRLLEPLARQDPAIPPAVDELRAGRAGAAVEALIERLRERAAENVEIERKYLLRALPPAVEGSRVLEVAQGYVPGRKLVERLRHVCGTGGDRWYRTIKAGRGLARAEFEEETTREIFEAMWPLTRGRRVAKRRFHVTDAAVTWEIDDFTDRELVLAEVELRSEDQQVLLPPWLAPYVVREVTGEGTYQNSRLAK